MYHGAGNSLLIPPRRHPFQSLRPSTGSTHGEHLSLFRRSTSAISGGSQIVLHLPFFFCPYYLISLSLLSFFSSHHAFQAPDHAFGATSYFPYSLTPDPLLSDHNGKSLIILDLPQSPLVSLSSHGGWVFDTSTCVLIAILHLPLSLPSSYG